MADRGDTHYRVPSLNRWFAVSSVLLLASSIWMVIEDFQRPWKEYQREFQKIEVARARAALEEPEAQAALEEETALRAELEATEASLASANSDLATAEAELIQLEADQFNATEAAKKAKQNYNWERYLAEEHLAHHGRDAAYEEIEANVLAHEAEMAALAGEQQVADDAVQRKNEEISAIRRRASELDAQMKQAVKSIDLVRKQLDRLAPEDLPTIVANAVRDDIPGFDFIGPRIKVRKVLPPDLTFELNFTKKGRIDMCQTCHLAADRAGFDDEAQPFASHPNLDLYLSAKSPHPLPKFGCTICHRGAGEALDFQRADHNASDEAEGEEWAEAYHWHKQHYWDYPMLSSEYIEASCVQCHKDSMELLEDSAPRVTEGYRLVERYACYSCHKIEGFGAKRRPGPSLAKILQKTDADFVSSWVARPKDFRPSTWMPQFFHLENYSADTEIVTSEYGTGRTMMGDEWSDAAIAAVSAYVESRSSTGALPAIPVQGDAKRGREAFRILGCLACHNTAPYGEEARAAATDPADIPNGSNEHGPNLRGLATKTNPEWLFAWIKDPAAWWHETRMPNLRLTDQEAADVVAYVFEDPDEVFHDVPEGWDPGQVAYERDVLEEQARWFFNRTLRSTLEERFDGEWSDDRALLEAVGERWVLNSGCHSCHEIPGLEAAQPIGTELTTWASKTVDKLDFGFYAEILAEERGLHPGSNEFAHFKAEFKSYRENFLEQKLREPRSFDRRKIKNPSERLRMPKFGFTEDQVKAIATFVVGLVEDEVQHARMIPTAEQATRNAGKRAVRQNNCAACHVIEPATVNFTDDDGVHHSVKANLLTFDGQLAPPDTTDFAQTVEDYVAWMRAEEDDEYEFEELGFEVREPTPSLGDDGAVGTKIFTENVDSITVDPAWGGDFVPDVTTYYLTGGGEVGTGDPEGRGRIQEVDGRWSDASGDPYDKVRWTYAPPSLENEGGKVQSDWFYRFLLDPHPLRKQIRVRMPTFNWQDDEASDVAGYFALEAAKGWPRRYARELMMSLGESPAEVAAGISALGLSGATAEQVEAIADGKAVAIEAGLANLMAYGESRGFSMAPAVDADHEDIAQRGNTFLTGLLEGSPSFYADVHRLATVSEGPKCTQCHFLNDAPPSKEEPKEWAPDLIWTRERLRPDWVREWLTNPALIYPGTAMPMNFPAGQIQYQELLPGSSEQQIEALVIWLFNLDRALASD